MQRPTVLIVDDSLMMTQFLSVFLIEKFNTLIFNCPVCALNEITKGCLPDLIITDLNLPKMDGFTFIQKVRELLASTPLVVISSETSSLVRMRSLILGADSFITKPFNPKELEIRIMKLIKATESQESLIEVEDYRTLSISKEILKRAAIF